MKNYYEILEVSSAASEDYIRSRYFELAKKYHPDVNTSPDAHKKFMDINEAYSVLSDTLRRADYDQKIEGAFMRKKAPTTADGGVGVPTGSVGEEKPSPPTKKEIAEAFMNVFFFAFLGLLLGGALEFFLWLLFSKAPFNFAFLQAGILWGFVAGLFWGSDYNFNVEAYLGHGYLGRSYSFLRTIFFALSFAYLFARGFMFLSPFFSEKILSFSGVSFGLIFGSAIGSQGEGVVMIKNKKGRFELLYIAFRGLLIGLAGLLVGFFLGLMIEMSTQIQITAVSSLVGFFLGIILGSINPANLAAYSSYVSSGVKNALVIVIAGLTLLGGMIFSYLLHDQISQLLSGKLPF